METPKSARCRPGLGDSPNTDVASIFDDLSPRLSCASPVTDCDYEDSNWARTQEPGSGQPAITQVPGNYGTAASQRPRRAQGKLPVAAPHEPHVESDTPQTVVTSCKPASPHLVVGQPRTSRTSVHRQSRKRKELPHEEPQKKTRKTRKIEHLNVYGFKTKQETTATKKDRTSSDLQPEKPKGTNRKAVTRKPLRSNSGTSREIDLKALLLLDSDQTHSPTGEQAQSKQLITSSVKKVQSNTIPSKSTIATTATKKSKIVKLKLKFPKKRTRPRAESLTLTQKYGQFEQPVSHKRHHSMPPTHSYQRLQHMPTHPINASQNRDEMNGDDDFDLDDTSQLRLRSPQPPTGSLLQTCADVDSNVSTEHGHGDFPDDSGHSRQTLRSIADLLFSHRSQSDTKPQPSGPPEVWADGRQELCETLHYFRSYQSACYCTGGFVRAFMFDKVAHARDYMDSNVIISRAGGGLIKDKETGEMKSGRDQSEDTTIVQALKNCMKHYNPLVIITGVDNPHMPSQPPHQYCVLDYFKPTHIWVEKSGKSKILRYRFEKLNTKKESWWKPKDFQEPVALGSLSKPRLKKCSACDVQSVQIYLNGWMCLQPSCTAFWRVLDGKKKTHEPKEDSLIYDPRFLKQKTPWPNDDHNYPLGSNIPHLSGYSIPGEDTSQAFWSGIVCPDCGRCNSRLNWMGWECLNNDCSFKRFPPHSLIPATTIRDPFWPITDSYTLSRDTHAALIDVSTTFSHGYRINCYTIPGLNGFVTHMIANKTVLEEPGGPDAMFEELQKEDIGLQRRAMPNGQLKGESYCRHFAVNYGMPYKFIAATASESFEKAARPITTTRSRLNWAAKHLLATTSGKTMKEVSKDWDAKEFNEVLALGYFEQQKINYHDDGEYGLGPTIATLSLGAPGTMRIRMKARHFHGASNAGVYNDALPLPGCAHYEARSTLHASLLALKASNPKAYRERLKQIPKELRLKTSGNAKDVLRMELGHGDIVVMHGAELQKYYEHAVEHQGKLRFALTCRYIDPESLAEADRPVYSVGRDEGGYDGSKLA